MMMGGFDVADFTSSGESVAVFVLFMIFVQLVMLNMVRRRALSHSHIHHHRVCVAER